MGIDIIVGFVLCWTIGLITGIYLRFERYKVGTFTINRTTPDENLFSIQFTRDITSIKSGRTISFLLKFK